MQVVSIWKMMNFYSVMIKKNIYTGCLKSNVLFKKM